MPGLIQSSLSGNEMAFQGLEDAAEQGKNQFVTNLEEQSGQRRFLDTLADDALGFTREHFNRRPSTPPSDTHRGSQQTTPPPAQRGTEPPGGTGPQAGGTNPQSERIPQVQPQAAPGLATSGDHDSMLLGATLRRQLGGLLNNGFGRGGWQEGP